MKKTKHTLGFLMLVTMLFLMMQVQLFAEVESNYTNVTIRFADNKPVANQEVILNGKTYITDKNGQFKTDYLPYGKYKPTISLSEENGKWDQTIFSQKIQVSRFSHLSSFDFLNNVYVYRKFRLGVSVVNSANKPMKDMKIDVFKGEVNVMSATVLTCVQGIISFNWQEMPGSSGVDNSVSMGDTLEVRVRYIPDENRYKDMRKEVKLDSIDEYVKIIAYEKNEDEISFAPILYEIEQYPVDESTSAVHMVFDYGIKAYGNDNSITDLDIDMFTLKDASEAMIPVTKATLKLNTVTLHYEKGKTPRIVTYTSESKEDGYLVNELNTKIKVANITDKKIESIYSQPGGTIDTLLKEYEDEVILLINEERVAAGLNILTQDDALTRSSRLKSNDQSFNGYLGHESEVYGWYYEQLKMLGYYDYDAYTENVASIPLSKISNGGNQRLTPKEAARSVFISWKNSPPHYQNILNRDVTRIGIGFSQGGLWTHTGTRMRGEVVIPIKAEPALYGGKTKVVSTGLVGNEATATAIPGEGYHFVNWTNKESGEVVSKDMNYTFTIEGPVTLVANFQRAKNVFTSEIKTVEIDRNGKLVMSQDIGGSTTGAGEYTYGEKVNFMATPKDGYNFYGWYFGDFVLNTDGTMPIPNKKSKELQIVSGLEDQKVTAVFKKIDKATIFIDPIDEKYQAVFDSTVLKAFGATKDTTKPYHATGGAFSTSGYHIPKLWDGGAPLGLMPSLSSYDYQNYRFLYWQDVTSGKKLESMGDLSALLYFDAEVIHVVPVFDDKPHQVKIAANFPMTGGNVVGLGDYKNNEKINIRAVANSGYKFDCWTDLSKDHQDYNNPNRTFNITTDTYLKPKFVEITQKWNVATSTNVEGVGEQFGTGAYFDQSTVTVMASIKNTKYKFDGWYEGDNLVYGMPIYSFQLKKDTNLEARYSLREVPYQLTIDAAAEEGSVVAQTTTDDALFYEEVELRQPQAYYYLDEVILEAKANPGYTFVGWYQDAREIGIENKCTVTMYGSTKVEARFIKDEQFTVIFKDFDGKTLKVDTVEKGGSAVAPEKVTRPGYTFAGWDMEFSNVNSHLVVTAMYTKTQEQFTVTVNNGTIEGTELTEKEYAYNSVVTLQANQAPAGQKFSHWESNGTTVGYEEYYKFIVVGNTTFTAVYVNKGEVEEQKPVVMIDPNVTINAETKEISFFAQIVVPETYTKVECGVLVSPIALSEENFILEAAGIKKGKSTSQSDTGQYSIAKQDVLQGETWYGRAYLVYQDSAGNLYTVYSDIVSGIMPEQIEIEKGEEDEKTI